MRLRTKRGWRSICGRGTRRIVARRVKSSSGRQSKEAAAQENARWRSTALTSSIESVGVRPSGERRDAPIVQAAVSVSKLWASRSRLPRVDRFEPSD